MAARIGLAAGLEKKRSVFSVAGGFKDVARPFLLRYLMFFVFDSLFFLRGNRKEHHSEGSPKRATPK